MALCLVRHRDFTLFWDIPWRTE